MAIKLISEERCPYGPYTNDVRKKYIVDTVADVAKLPVCCAGSMALVATGKVYIVNASGQWVEFGGTEG